jgi:hypothetical protein
MIHSVSARSLLQIPFAFRNETAVGASAAGFSADATGKNASEAFQERSSAMSVVHGPDAKTGNDEKDAASKDAAGGAQETQETSQTKQNQAEDSPSSGDTTGEELTRSQEEDVRQLQQRDREVRSHEQAHIAAGGAYIRSGARYEFERGPDGQNYAVGGEVRIDTSPVKGDPEATIRKMQTVRSAALAPAEPSNADRAVAAKAAQIAAQARVEKMEEQQKRSGEASVSSEKSRTRHPETDRYIQIQSSLKKGDNVNFLV